MHIGINGLRIAEVDRASDTRAGDKHRCAVAPGTSAGKVRTGTTFVEKVQEYIKNISGVKAYHLWPAGITSGWRPLLMKMPRPSA